MGKVIALVSTALDGIDSGDLCACVDHQLFAVARLKARCRQVQHLQPRGRHPLHLTVAPSITFSERETDLAKSAQLHSRNVSSMQHSWAATRFLDSLAVATDPCAWAGQEAVVLSGWYVSAQWCKASVLGMCQGDLFSAGWSS